jgi:hypothetical protein
MGLVDGNGPALVGGKIIGEAIVMPPDRVAPSFGIGLIPNGFANSGAATPGA